MQGSGWGWGNPTSAPVCLRVCVTCACACPDARVCARVCACARGRIHSAKITPPIRVDECQNVRRVNRQMTCPIERAKFEDQNLKS